MDNPYHEMDPDELQLELLRRLGWTHIGVSRDWYAENIINPWDYEKEDIRSWEAAESLQVGIPPGGEHAIPTPNYLDRLELVLNLPMPLEYAHWMLMYDPKDNGARAWIEWDGPSWRTGLPEDVIEPEVSQWGLARACIEAWLLLDDFIREWKNEQD